MYLILAVIVTVILIEAITGILCKSELFKPIRGFLFESNNKTLKFIHNILDCSYCTSVWVSLFCTVMLALDIMNLLPQILALFFIGVVLHRVSNVLHFIIDRIDSNYVNLDKE
ncbi:hypothetical protein LCGC14_2137580 [marine sediment metagenome]|uniref:DUF1360 domain-containing protein n=1 Tax=marine sediment metagenome TaxID=412755 RepID=A0A0F9DZL5_9ZZZZ